MLVSIIIPAYNESATIEEILRRVLGASLGDGVTSEIVVVDDGSSDGTREKLASLPDAPGLKVVLHERNMGKGAAIRTGLAHAKGDVIVIQDADLEYDPGDIAALLRPIMEGRADVVYGSRFLAGPARKLYFWHYLGNKALTLFTNVLFDLNLTDMETCYKTFRASLKERLEIESNDFRVEPELTAKFAMLGCRIYEVPISYHGRLYSEGKKIGWKDGLRAISTLVRLRVFPSRTRHSS